LSGDRFYVDPSDSAVREQALLRSENEGAQAAQIATIAANPMAIWLTADDQGAARAISETTSAAQAAGEVPIFVLYDLPWRDCGSYSAGGASSPQDYEAFVSAIAQGIGSRNVVLIVEPDALMELTCQPAAHQATYLQLVHHAVTTLSADPNAHIYVDAGNPGADPGVLAGRLAQALAGTHAGFAVNVSNFFATSADVAYGTAISAATGGRHFVIDTSRNGGSVPAGEWCNPAGAHIGAAPTTHTGDRLVDADLWIKLPGESDGTCNGGPTAGTFWLSYALQLTS
jgi:endoglucanase